MTAGIFTRTYQLDSGQHVRIWLDEPIGYGAWRCLTMAGRLAWCR